MANQDNGQSIATKDMEISENHGRGAPVGAKVKKPTALERMALRLEIDPGRLQSVLRNTVFKKANDEEFAALVIIANEYDLNPLTKEIYAFPSRNGIMPMVSYDGWIKIVNRHPAYNGYEHNEIVIDGKFEGVESIFHRKDLDHPVKKTVYLEEFKMNTDPWKTKPRHMTQLRSYCQTARLAFGISGLYIEGEELEFVDEIQPMKQALPTTKELRKADAEEAGADPDTGEVAQDERSEQDVAEELDAKQAAQERGEEDEEPEEEAEPDRPAWEAKFEEIDAMLAKATSQADWTKADAEFQKHAVTFPDDKRVQLEEALNRVAERVRSA